MDTLQAVITGAVQGLSEFLPISSSAHIVFSNELYNLIAKSATSDVVSQEEIFFNIMVHLATLIAVVIYFFNDLKEILFGACDAIKEKKYDNKNFRLLIYILFSTLITGTIGLLIKDEVEKLISYPIIICVFLFGTGLILLFSEKMYKGNKGISLKNAIYMAIAQGLAVFPGFSRSGLTISTAIFLGMNRTEAAKFSFLMSIPVIFMASLIYPLFELNFNMISTFNHKAMILGFLTSFIIGYLCIKYFMKLLGQLGLKIFGYYCLIASLVMMTIFQVFYHQ